MFIIWLIGFLAGYLFCDAQRIRRETKELEAQLEILKAENDRADLEAQGHGVGL